MLSYYFSPEEVTQGSRRSYKAASCHVNGMIFKININPRRVGGHGFIVVVWILVLCLFVISEPAHLAVIALRLQHG